MEVLTRTRKLEFFELSDLQVATGVLANQFHLVILKELMDNAIDACEDEESPGVEVCIHSSEKGLYSFCIGDNGPGLSAEDIEKILDFEHYASSKSAYKIPTRGRLGNALKTIVGIPIAMNHQTEMIPLIIHTRGIKYTVKVVVNPIVQDLKVSIDTEPSPYSDTRFIVTTSLEEMDFDDCREMVECFALFNPGIVFDYHAEENHENFD